MKLHTLCPTKIMTLNFPHIFSGDFHIFKSSFILWNIYRPMIFLIKGKKKERKGIFKYFFFAVNTLQKTFKSFSRPTFLRKIWTQSLGSERCRDVVALNWLLRDQQQFKYVDIYSASSERPIKPIKEHSTNNYSHFYCSIFRCCSFRLWCWHLLFDTQH